MSSNVTKVKVTLISWRVPFELCKLLCLRYNCDVSEQDFFSLVRNQNIEREKCDNASSMVKPCATGRLPGFRVALSYCLGQQPGRHLIMHAGLVTLTTYPPISAF
jgi:hypothetical protein